MAGTMPKAIITTMWVMLLLYVDGKPVIIDVGSGTYTSKTFSSDRFKLWYNSSAYHNLPLINGFQQEEREGSLKRRMLITALPAIQN